MTKEIQDSNLRAINRLVNAIRIDTDYLADNAEFIGQTDGNHIHEMRQDNAHDFEMLAKKFQELAEYEKTDNARAYLSAYRVAVYNIMLPSIWDIINTCEDKLKK